MTIWRTLKATVVGIHADYHTGFERLREKYGKKDEEEPRQPPVFHDSPELYDLARRPLRERRKRAMNVDLLSGFSPRNSVANALQQLEQRGWSNLAVVPSYPGESLMVTGNFGEEYGQYEVVRDSKGAVTEVRTHDSVRKL